MKNRRMRLTITLVLLLAVLVPVTWLFIHGITKQFETNSIRAITESTHQGANALDLQLEADLAELKQIGENLVKANSNELPDLKLEDMLNIYNIVDPDIALHHHGAKGIEEFGSPDTAVCRSLKEAHRQQGILDTHINEVTGESVFNLFLKIPLAEGMDTFLLKEYRAKEIADQFTLSFYDNAGFSYLVNRDGAIMVRSSHRNSNKTMSNLFDMISETENDPDMIRLFRKSINDLRSGWASFTYKGDGMIFCYEPLRADSEWLVVSIVPQNVIAEQTKDILITTILFAGTLLFIILVVITVFYIAKLRENREHTRELEQALASADSASKAKGSFLMNMSHDIRTPLNAILGMTAIAQDHLPDQERVADCLQKIETSGTQLLTLVNDVLDMSEIEDGKMVLREVPIQLSQLVTSTAELMQSQARACKADLNLELLPIRLQNETVIGDPDRIRQVLLNIISNAIKYSPDGGHITLELTQADGAAAGCGLYRFRCTDTGIGMSAEFLEKMFLPFERDKDTTNSKVAGAGVGLTITKSLLDLMGGTICAESEPGKGSTFRVELMLRLPEPAAAADEVVPLDTAFENADVSAVSEGLPAKNQEEPDYSGKRVLLVEDNELNMEIAEELIGILEAQVEKAFDGQEAVNMFRSHPCGYYDLIFMDIQMPVMNGYDATRQIRATEREDAGTIPIFAMSANAFAEDIENSLASGMNGHIAKPIDLEPIEKVFKEYFL